MERRRLIDLGFISSKFTCNHGVQRDTRKSAWLDRALCNDVWRRLCPSTVVFHLFHAHSGHSPILLKLDGKKSRRLGDRSFKFQAAWMLHSEFFKWTEKKWARTRELVSSLKRSTKKLQSWNRSTFDNLFRRKQRNRLRLKGVTRALENKVTTGLLRLEGR